MRLISDFKDRGHQICDTGFLDGEVPALAKHNRRIG